MIRSTFHDVCHNWLHLRRFSLALSHHQRKVLHSNDSIGGGDGGYRRASSIAAVESSIARIDEDAYSSPEEAEKEGRIVAEPRDNMRLSQDMVQGMQVICTQLFWTSFEYL